MSRWRVELDSEQRLWEYPGVGREWGNGSSQGSGEGA